MKPGWSITAVIPVRVKRWRDGGRVKLENQRPGDERLLQLCREYVDKMCGREMKINEEKKLVVVIYDPKREAA